MLEKTPVKLGNAPGLVLSMLPVGVSHFALAFALECSRDGSIPQVCANDLPVDVTDIFGLVRSIQYLLPPTYPHMLSHVTS